MAHWSPATQQPTRSGEYRCRCGKSDDTFWALWNAKLKRWTHHDGAPIVFGFMPEEGDGDVWRPAKRRKK